MPARKFGCWPQLAALFAIAFLLRTGRAAPDDDRSYRAGVGLANKGMNDMAVVELQSYLKEHPDGSSALNARYTLAVCLVRTGKHTAAVQELDQVLAVREFEFHADAMLLRAQCAIAGEDDVAAQAILKSLLKEHPTFSQADHAAELRGESLYRVGKVNEARSALQEFATKWPKSTLSDRAAVFCALAEVANGDLRAAATRMHSLQQSSTDQAYSAHAALIEAQCRHRLGELSAAAALYENAMNRGDAQVKGEAILGAASVFRTQGQFAQAERLLKDASSLSPPEPRRSQIRLEQGCILFDQGRADGAIEVFESLASDAPPSLADAAAYWTAKCNAKLGRLDRAVDELAAAAAKYPKSDLLPDMLFDHASALSRVGKDEASLAAWATWRERFRSHELAPDALLAQAGCAHRLGQYETSLSLCDEFLRASPDHARVAAGELLFAENLYLLQRYDKAMEAYRSFGMKHSDDPSAWRARIRRGLCLLKLERASDGVGLLSEALGEKRTNESTDRDLRREAVAALGDHLFARGDWASAERWFEELSREGTEGKSDADAILRYGLCLERQKRSSEALSVLERAAKVGGSTAQGLHAAFECGQVLVELGRLDQARSKFEEVVAGEITAEKQALTPHALRHLATIASKQGKPEEAATILAKVSKASAGDEAGEEALFQQASSWLAAEKYDRAEQTFAKFIESGSNPVKVSEARAWRAVAINRIGRHADALKAMDALSSSLASLDPETAAATRYERALALRSLGRDAEAAEAYRALLAQPLGPSLAAFAALDLAQIEIKSEQYEEALKSLDRCREMGGQLKSEDTARARERELYFRGLCLLKLNKPADAVKELAPFRDLYPSSELIASVALVLGDALLQAGRAKEAGDQLQQVVEGSPSAELQSVALLKLGDARAAAQQWTKCDEAYTLFLDHFAENSLWFQARFGQGWARENQKRYSAAIEAYRDVVSRHQGITAARAQFQIGECLYAMEKREEAVSELLKVDVLYAYPEWSAAALYEAGRCLNELNRASESTRQFDDLVKRFPDTNWAKLAKERSVAGRPADLPGRPTEAPTKR